MNREISVIEDGETALLAWRVEYLGRQEMNLTNAIMITNLGMAD